LYLKLSTVNIMTYPHLAHLEHLLMHEEAFEKTYSYFMDYFGVNPAFIEVGQKTSVPTITTMLGEICRQFFKKEAIVLTGLMVIKVDELNLLHGFVHVEGHLMVFFYCKKINRGMACLNNMLSATSKTHYFRITPQSADGKPLPSELFKDIFAGTEN
jgi:hypothetical protein